MIPHDSQVKKKTVGWNAVSLLQWCKKQNKTETHSMFGCTNLVLKFDYLVTEPLWD